MKIHANGTEISVISGNSTDDYISLTDLARYRNPDDPAGVVGNWLRNRNTIDYLGLWEEMFNPNFKLLEFEEFRKHAGENAFTLSPQKWIAQTNAIGLTSRSGRGGGTFAHKDIAFEFASWISPEFKLYVIKDYQRLKLNEADLLNIALFGKTAKQWRLETGNKKLNMRDFASVEQLIVLVNLESMNADMIRQDIPAPERLKKLRSVAYYQINSLVSNNSAKKLKATIENRLKEK